MAQKSQYRIFQEKFEKAHQVPILNVAAHFGYGGAGLWFREAVLEMSGVFGL